VNQLVISNEQLTNAALDALERWPATDKLLDEVDRLLSELYHVWAGREERVDDAALLEALEALMRAYDEWLG